MKASRSGVEVEQGGVVSFVDFEYLVDAGRRPLALIAAALVATGCPRLPLRMTEKFKKIQFDLNIPEDIEASDRLHFFNRNLRSFNTTLQWQTQAELKNLIKIILNQLSTCHSEQLVSLNEDKIKLVDFLLAAFVLNRLLI